MTAKIDQTLSKRPLRTTPQQEVRDMERERSRLIKELEELETLVRCRDATPEYKAVVDNSFQALQQIAWDRMMLDVKDVPTNAIMVGRFQERLLLTREMLSAKERKQTIKGRLLRIGFALKRILSQLGGQA